MPRSLWTGSIAFGLVNVPVRLYPAIREHRLHFRLVHEPDGGPVGYRKICKAEDRPVPDEEIVKAFEVSRGEYVYLRDEDFERAQVEGRRSIDILDFVPYAEIDPIYFAHTYYAGPQDGAERVYGLLVRAMERSELAAIAKFVLRERQHLGALRVREGVIALEQLHFADEIRPVDEIRPPKQRIEKQELAMAEQLVRSLQGPWRPERYEDTYRAELCAAIEARRAGEEPHRAAEVEEEAPADLLEALRASIRGAGRPGTRGRDGNGSLAKLTKTELDRRAREAGVEGRSRMTKDELVEALRRAG